MSFRAGNSVTVDPAAQTVGLGNEAVVDVRIFGFDPNPNADPYPGPLAVGMYDLTINYDPAILSLKSFAYGDALGAWNSDSSTIFDDYTTPGSLRIFEESLLGFDALYARQNDNFIAITLTFDTIGAGVSPLTFNNSSLWAWSVGTQSEPYAYDVFLNYYADNGSVTVTTSAVPEPATMLLLGIGLIGIAGMRRKLR